MSLATTEEPVGPLLVGDPAHRTFSTCTALVPDPLVCHDVNGYYRELGVAWRATRGELRRAYLARHGQRSRRLTYVLSQLLDRTVRRRYDRAPLGCWLADRYVREQMWREMLRGAGGDHDRLRGLASAFGIDLDGDPAGALDEGSLEDQDEGAPPEQDPFPYGYYLWRAGHPDREVLSAWQDLLVRAASRRGVVAQVAVGVVGRTPHPWVLARVGYVDALLINERVEPTEALADAAIQSLSESG